MTLATWLQHHPRAAAARRRGRGLPAVRSGRSGFEGSVGVVSLDDLDADAAASAVQARVERFNALLS